MGYDSMASVGIGGPEEHVLNPTILIELTGEGVGL
jgi:hypothetical protein